MPKATLMVRFKRPSDSSWSRRPAAFGTTGRVRAGFAIFRDRAAGNMREEPIGENYAFEIRIEDGSTTYQPAGRHAADAVAQFRRVAAKLEAKTTSEAVGLTVTDPEKEVRKRFRLEDTFEDYIDDAEKRGAMEAREQAVLVKKEFLSAVSVAYADEINRDCIIDFDFALRRQGRSERTISNKRQRLQSMLRWSGVDPQIFPPKPRFEKKLPTIYTPDQLAGLFRVATPYQTTVCNLALKLGVRDQEVQFAEFTDVSWHESVFRVRSKPKFNFKVKDYEERDIPIPLDFLEELRIWKEQHPNQNLIVPTSTGRPNTKLLPMVKGMARRAGIECGWCANCIAGVKGARGCDEFELHKFRRTCITTWLRNGIDPRTVMEYAGHADMETTLRYLRPAAAQERIAAVSGIKWY
jgi:integrase